MAVSTDNVSVTISVADKSIDQTGFGVPMIVGPTQAFIEVTKSYSASSGLAAMVTDGFAVTDPEYLAASAILAVSPRPDTFKVGRRAPSNVPDFDLTVTPGTPVEGEVFTITIGGVAFSATADATPTATEIATALETAISVSGMTTVDNTGSLSLQATTAGTVFDVECSANLGVDDITADAAIATELALVAADDDAWYGLVLASHSTLETVAAAAWCESNRKQFFPSSSDTDILSDTSGNLLETLNAAGYNYTQAMFSRRPGDFPGAAWMGARYPLQPGKESWKYVTLPGITVDTLTTTQINNIRSNKGNYYTSSSGVSMTSEGWSSSGRYTDITRSSDWLVARIGEEIFSTMANAAAVPGKISFTDSGINQIVSSVQSVLDRAVAVGMLVADPKPIVTFPTVASVPIANKAARTLPDIDFSATLAGAIHKAAVTGKVTI